MTSTVRTTIFCIPLRTHFNICRTSFWSASSGEHEMIDRSDYNTLSMIKIPSPFAWISRESGYEPVFMGVQDRGYYTN